MKKFFTLMVALFAVLSMNAQTKNYAGSSNFLDNWSIGVRGGVQSNLKDWNKPQGAVAGIELNKQLTPLFGFTIEGLAGVNNIRNWAADAKHFCNGVAIDQLSVIVDGRFNLTNALFMYNGKPRFFEVEALGGIGYGHTYNAGAKGDDYGLAKAGLNFNFNLGKQKAWTINIQPAVVWSLNDKCKLNANHAVAQLTAGIVYHFKTSNGHRYINKYDLDAILADNSAQAQRVNELEQLNKEQNAEIDALRKAIAAQPVGTAAVAKNEVVEKNVFVFFAQNSSVLTDDAKAILDGVNAKTVKVVATASPEGTKEYNQALSEKRAEIVAEHLKARGINVAEVKGLGVTGDASGRAAVITAE